jgi:hypothetical protein
MASAQTNGQKMKVRSREFNWDHVMDMTENMHRIHDLLLPFQQQEDQRQRKLKEFPKGFHLNGKGYSCAICSGTTGTALSAWNAKRRLIVGRYPHTAPRTGINGIPVGIWRAISR